MITMRVAGTLGGDLDAVKGDLHGIRSPHPGWRGLYVCYAGNIRISCASRRAKMAASPKRRMLRFVEERPEHAAALDRVRAWTRERFALADDAAILVSEVSCALPGCPPRETVVAFWTETERRHQFKLFKPVAEVVMDDLPPRWLKDALAAIEGLGCECC